MQKISRIMEIFWLSLGVVALILFFVLFYRDGWDKAAIYLLFPAIAFAMFGMRRFIRKRLEKNDDGSN